MSGRPKSTEQVIEEEYDLSTGIITGEFMIDGPTSKVPDSMSRIRKMLKNRVGEMVLQYDMTRNEAVSYLLYEDGYSNSEVVAIMTRLFKRNFLKQNVNDYRKKALDKIEAVDSI